MRARVIFENDKKKKSGKFDVGTKLVEDLLILKLCFFIPTSSQMVTGLKVRL